MVENLTTIGAEFLIKLVFTEEITKPANVTVGLYDDSVDALTEDDDAAAITTEPNDGAYAALTYAFGTADFASTLDATSGDWSADFAEKTFDITDTTGYVDSYFLTAEFTAEGDTAAAPHLLTFDRLEDTQGEPMRLDLGTGTSFNISGELLVP